MTTHSPTILPPVAHAAPRWLRLAHAGSRVSAALLALGLVLTLASLVLCR